MTDTELIDNLFRILHCFAENEGTLFEVDWHRFGIREEHGAEIVRIFIERFESDGAR